MTRIIKSVSTVFVSIIFSCCALSASANDDTPPVAELRALLNKDSQLAVTLQNAMDNATPLPDGSTNPWHKKDLEYLFKFLNDWYYFLPEKHNGMSKIVGFSYFYYKNPQSLKFITEEPGLSWAKRFAEHRGKYLDSKESKAGVDLWLNNKSVSNDDFIEPEGGYQSFNEYFIRDLKPGARPVASADNDAVVVSPADCIINHIANELTADSAIPTKGRMSLNLSQLLDESKYAKKFIGGNAFACFLLPDNYHHYHSPVAGSVVEAREQVGNKLFGMDDLIGMVNKGNPGYEQDFSVFEDFKHGYLIINTKALGYVAMVPIGLQTVGSVVFQERFKYVNKSNKQAIAKGEKVGHFAYGGSTVLLIFEPGRFNALSMKQGQRIGEAH